MGIPNGYKNYWNYIWNRREALSQAKDGRVHILGEMNKALSASRADVGKHTQKWKKLILIKKTLLQ